MSRPKSKPMRQALPMIKHAIKSYEIKNTTRAIISMGDMG